MNSNEFSILLAELEAIRNLCNQMIAFFESAPDVVEFTIVKVDRGVTRQSHEPKWTLTSDNGFRVWIIQHPDPMKDSTAIWKEKGGLIWVTLQTMAADDYILCDANPIRIKVKQEGEFYRVVDILNNPLHGWTNIDYITSSGSDEDPL